MKKIIRSISILDSLDQTLKDDSQYRGLTVSANITRILFDHFQTNSIQNKDGLNLLPTKRVRSD
jgi:hypothetical protein